MTPMELIRILDSGMVEELTMYYNGSHTVVNIRNLPEIMPDYEINKLWNSEDGKGISVLLADNMRQTMNNDLISREALKKATKSFTDCDGFNPVWQIIDNALPATKDNRPAICFNCEHCCALTVNSDGEVKVMCNLGAENCDKQRPHGKWIITAEDNDGIHRIQCPFCRYEKGSDFIDYITVTFEKFPPFCENCGAKMDGGEES